MLQGDVEYFGLLLIKSSDPQSYSNGHKRGILLQCATKSAISVQQEGFTALKLVTNNF